MSDDETKINEGGIQSLTTAPSTDEDDQSLSDLSEVETEISSIGKDANPAHAWSEATLSTNRSSQPQRPPSRSFLDDSLVLNLIQGKEKSWEESPSFRADLAAAHLFSLVPPSDIPPPPGLGVLWATRAVLSTSMEPAFKTNVNFPTTMAANKSLVGLGTTTGAIHLLMQSKLRTLEEPSIAPDVITAMGIGQYGSKSSASNVVIAGHASGGLALWQAGTMPTKVKTLTGLHAAPVTAVAPLRLGNVNENNVSNWALTGDAHGRIVCHNIGMLLHSNAAVQALAGLARQWTGTTIHQSSPSFLLPIEFPSDRSNVKDCGSILSLSPLDTMQSMPGEKYTSQQKIGNNQKQQLVLIVATQLIAIATVNESSSSHPTALQVLHSFTPPSPGAIGYAAWQQMPMPRGNEVIVAVGWSGHGLNDVNVYSISQNDLAFLTKVPIPSTSTSLCGLAFFESGPLTIICASGEASLDVSVCHPALWQGQSMDGAIDTLRINDWMVSRQQTDLFVTDEASNHAAIAVVGDRVLILTSRGVRVVCLLTWRQGIAAMMASSDHLEGQKAALLKAVRLHRASFNDFGLQENAAISPAWPAERARASEQGDLEREILSILSNILLQKATNVTVEGGCPADVVIATCCATGQEAALFDQFAPQFISAQANVRSEFFRGVEDAVMRGELNRVAPELMQALVEHEVAQDRLDSLEQTVLRLDLLSLDLNQLIPLCIKHRLYGALIRIFDGAMQDYASPAALLLLAACEESGDRARHLLLAYLRGCLSEGERGECSAQATALTTGGSLGTSSEVMTANRTTRMRYQSASFLLHASTQAIRAAASTWTELVVGDKVGGQTTGLSLLRDPSPALRFLCQTDVHSTLCMLRHGLAGWDALESEVKSFGLGAAGDGSQSSTTVTVTVTQAVVDRLAGFIQESLVDGVGAMRLGNKEQEALLNYIADMASSGRVEAPSPILVPILDHLSRVGDETSFSNVLRSFTEDKLELAEEVLALARRAGFGRAEAKILGACGRHGEAVDRLLAVSTERIADAFEYIRDLYRMRHLTNQSSKTSNQQLDMATWMFHPPRLVALVRADALQTAMVMEECFPTMHSAVLSALEPWEDEQFAYLHALYGSAFSGRMRRDGDGDGEGARMTLPEDMERKTSSLYVRLLCRYDPDSVLPFLEAHDSYDIDSCLRQCKKANAWQAAAYLLERRGEVSAALNVYLEEIQSSNDALIALIASSDSIEDTLVKEEAEIRCRRVMEVAVSACCRISQSDPLHGIAMRNAKGTAKESMAHQSWMSIIDVYTRALMSIEKLDRGWKEKAKANPARRVLESLLESVLSVAAGYVAAQDLAKVVMSRTASVGDVKDIVSGLVETCAFERELLRRSAKITGDDVLGALNSGYRAGAGRNSFV